MARIIASVMDRVLPDVESALGCDLLANSVDFSIASRPACNTEPQAGSQQQAA